MMPAHHRGFSTLPGLIFIQPEGLQRKWPISAPKASRAGARGLRRVRQSSLKISGGADRHPLPGGERVAERSGGRVRGPLQYIRLNDYAALSVSAGSPAFARKFSRSEPPVTFTIEPSRISPRRMRSASGSCSSFCMTRFRGRAP
jgi:hypothetical protein